MIAHPRPLRLFFFGDSFVNGVGDGECLGWVGRVCAGLGGRGRDVAVYNLGVRRDTSRAVMGRWRREAEARLTGTADVCLVFSFGVNDCMVEDGAPRVPLPESVGNARTILAEAASLGRVLFVGPPPIADPEANLRIVSVSEALRGACAELGVPFLDTVTPLLRCSQWMEEVPLGDGAHPGAGGYRHLADLVAAWPAWRAWREVTNG